MPGRKLAPTHPGALVRVEFLEALGVTPYRVAKDLGVPAPRLNDILLGKRGISAEMAVLLAHYFGTSKDFFLNLQCDYDRRLAQAALKPKLARIKPLARDRGA